MSPESTARPAAPSDRAASLPPCVRDVAVRLVALFAATIIPIQGIAQSNSEKTKETRKRALAAVIDHGFGENCTASVIESRKDSLPEAVADLARRERCEEHHIGVLHRSSGFSRAKQSRTTALVREWLHTTYYHAAIWTDAESNFEVMTGEVFTVSTAVEYLECLPEDSLREAKRYIEKAPVSTPLRRELQEKTWWIEVEY